MTFFWAVAWAAVAVIYERPEVQFGGEAGLNNWAIALVLCLFIDFEFRN